MLIEAGAEFQAEGIAGDEFRIVRRAEFADVLIVLFDGFGGVSAKGTAQLAAGRFRGRSVHVGQSVR